MNELEKRINSCDWRNKLVHYKFKLSKREQGNNLIRWAKIMPEINLDADELIIKGDGHLINYFKNNGVSSFHEFIIKSINPICTLKLTRREDFKFVNGFIE